MNINKRFQDISFRVSRYVRPLAPWHCGGQEDGSQCILGPDKNGNCRAIVDCAPNKEGNTWECTRSKLLGGACKSGPSSQGSCGKQRPPCKPVPNLRARRQRIAWITMATMLALAALAVTLSSWHKPINPGPLSRQHAAFGTEDCGACHAAAELPKQKWLASVFGSDMHTNGNIVGGIKSDEERCISCHRLSDDVQVAQNPHSLPATELASLTQASKALLSADGEGASLPKSLLVGFAQKLQGGAASTDSLSCATCHQEHQGSAAHIVAITDQQCSVCHSNSFASFDDHPEFKNYPAEQRTNIIFSHTSHLNKHFNEEKNLDLAPQGCVTCHEADPIGRKMEVSNFDAACSSCHLSQITGESRAAEKGVAMLSIPAIDTDTLTERGVSVGEWPAATDAELTPLNLLLIAAIDSELAANIKTFSDLDLYDLSSASDEELELVYRAVWALKRSYFELQRGGGKAILSRLASVLPSDAEQPQKIIGLLSPNLIDKALESSLPNLESEMIAWLKEGKPAFSIRQKAVAEPAKAAAPVSVSTDDDDDWLSSVSDDSGDDDDWLNDASGDDSDAAEEFSLDEDDELSLDDDEGDDWLASASTDSADSDDDDWLSGATSDDSDSDDDWLNDVSDDSTEFDDDDSPQVESMAEGSNDSQGGGVTQDIPDVLSLEDRAAAGGWYFEDFYLRYRPSGHSDDLIVAWVDTLLAGTAKNPALTRSMYRSLTSKNSPGSCMKCHSVDVETNAGVEITKVNWWGSKTAPNVHDFNSFAHSSHFGVVNNQTPKMSLVNAEGEGSNVGSGCRSCHTLNDQADSSIAYEADAAGAFESDFLDLDKQQCANCHQAEPELSTCTQCHNYHIGERKLVGIEDGFRKVALDKE